MMLMSEGWGREKAKSFSASFDISIHFCLKRVASRVRRKRIFIEDIVNLNLLKECLFSFSESVVNACVGVN